MHVRLVPARQPPGVPAGEARVQAQPPQLLAEFATAHRGTVPHLPLLPDCAQIVSPPPKYGLA
jgi:hypothetical protein